VKRRQTRIETTTSRFLKGGAVVQVMKASVNTEKNPVGPLRLDLGQNEYLDRLKPGTAKSRAKESEDDDGHGGIGDDEWADPLMNSASIGISEFKLDWQGPVLYLR